MLLFNSKALLSQWKPRDAAENLDTYRNLQPHRAVLPAIARHLVSRSYCYTVRSAIGILLLSVRPSVCLSVCLRHCALWLSGLVYRAKSCTSVFLADKFLFVPSDTFAVRFSHKSTGNKTSQRKRERVFETQKTTRALVYSALLTENLRRSTSRSSLVTLEWIEFARIHKM